MEPSVIHTQGLVPAHLDGKGSFVKSHVTRAFSVTDVNNSVFVWMVLLVILLQGTAHVHQVTEGTSKYIEIIWVFNIFLMYCQLHTDNTCYLVTECLCKFCILLLMANLSGKNCLQLTTNNSWWMKTGFVFITSR